MTLSLNLRRQGYGCENPDYNPTPPTPSHRVMVMHVVYMTSMHTQS